MRERVWQRVKRVKSRCRRHAVLLDIAPENSEHHFVRVVFLALCVACLGLSMVEASVAPYFSHFEKDIGKTVFIQTNIQVSLISCGIPPPEGMMVWNPGKHGCIYRGRLDKIKDDVLTISASYDGSTYRRSIDIRRESIKEISLQKIEPVPVLPGFPEFSVFKNTLRQPPTQYSDAPLHSLQLEFIVPPQIGLRVDYKATPEG